MSRINRMLSGKPVHPIGEDGRMSLSDHFRELRARVMRSALVAVVIFAIALVFNRLVLEAVLYPWYRAQAIVPENVAAELFVGGPTAGLLLPLKLAGLAALVLSSPYWLYQMWSFIMPGLHPHERKWSRVFAAVAGPLFLIGAALGFLFMPNALGIMISLVPQAFTNRIDFPEYLSFLSRTLLAFGLAFEIPVFVILLNRVGLLRVETIGRIRSWVILGSFIFAAVATPSGDPFTMLALAIPMVVLYELAGLICRFLERRDAKRMVELSP
jgi:sec-independent protein translocase protein TatC